MLTGIETSIAFLHSPRTETRFWSMSKVVPTRRSCSRANSNGFSRRWDVVTTAVTSSLLLSLQTGEKTAASASLARCVGVQRQVPRIRNGLGPARRRGDHRGVVGAVGERRGGRIGERVPQLGVGRDPADDPDPIAPD